MNPQAPTLPIERFRLLAASLSFVIGVLYCSIGGAQNQCLPFYNSTAENQVDLLQSSIRSLLAEWNQIPAERRKSERRISIKINQQVKDLLNLRTIKFTNDPNSRRVQVITPDKQGSPWNRFAFDVARSMNGLRVVYDPLELKKNEAGALFVDTSNTLYISNEVILKKQPSTIWHTSFELHEIVHAFVTELQRRKMWNPFWAELTMTNKNKTFMETYDHYIALDEIMAYYKQILTELAKVNASDETQGMLEFLVPIAKKMSEVVFKNLSPFNQIKTAHHNKNGIEQKLDVKEIAYLDGATWVTLSLDGVELSLLVSYKKNLKREDAISLAEEQIQELAHRTRLLGQLYAEINQILPSHDHQAIRALLSKNRDLIAFDVRPR